MRTIEHSVSLVLAGEAGQGIQSIEAILTGLLRQSGYHLFAVKEYMSRVRGGTNSISIRVASSPVRAFSERIDILIPLTAKSIPHLSDRITADTVIIGDPSVIDLPGLVRVPFNELALAAGGAIYANSVAAGVLAGIMGISSDVGSAFVASFFEGKKEAVIAANLHAFRSGYAASASVSDISVSIRPALTHGLQLVSGSEAVAFGALAGGCNYVAAYPMSPSTGVLERLAAYSRNFDIIVEQVEDEVGVVNMALGAWYAGARALVTTSGGGFALMSEGISLAGMTELPLVIHLAQRPGPATGLPTRTEQGDLTLALHAGHGDFPRLLLAPGDAQEAAQCTAEAFAIADGFQVPAFILTDQYLVDSYGTLDPDALSFPPLVNHIERTDAAYLRYAHTLTGISPRGVPGWGAGLVAVDSDEHDTSGHITESAAVRNAMVEKRMRKGASLRTVARMPEGTGSADPAIIVAGWGSTRHIIAEALERINDSRVRQLHFSWLYPLPENIADSFGGCDRIIMVENNATGQFAGLLRREAGIACSDLVLKYNGMPFSVEELETRLRAILEVR
jgi:2-oxoglutarate/2-oxoacid ferredoxin oxidoreductase subunit alpha